MVSVYALQSGRTREEEGLFTISGQALSLISNGERLLGCGDLSGNVSDGLRNVDRF